MAPESGLTGFDYADCLKKSGDKTVQRNHRRPDLGQNPGGGALVVVEAAPLTCWWSRRISVANIATRLANTIFVFYRLNGLLTHFDSEVAIRRRPSAPSTVAVTISILRFMRR